LDKSISEALSLSSAEIRFLVQNTTKLANDLLLQMETEALNLLQSGNNKKALEILFNDTYIQQKKVYAHGMSILFDYIQHQISKSLSFSTTFTFIVNTCLVMTIPISLLIGFDSVIQRCVASRKHEQLKMNEIERINNLNVAYKRFLPEEFLKLIGTGDIQKVKKGDATSKEISVLFSDIRNFTSMTENMNPEESFSFINQILDFLAPIITKNNGFIDKFVGDCIMALFPNSVDDSIKCGYEMLEALEKYNLECRKNKVPVEIGIGIHYGNVMIGTIGTENRMDSTVISDAVNTASRVENLTKTLGAKFIVTEDLILKSDQTNLKKVPIGKYLLKGKRFPMSLYQMLDKNSTIDPNHFSQGINHFQLKEFEKAEKVFSTYEENISKYLQKVSKYYQNFEFDDFWSGEIKIDKDGVLIELKNPKKNEFLEEELNILERIEDEKTKEMLRSFFEKNQKLQSQSFSDNS
jgi:class 3 adenylate cyclase